MHGSSDQQDSTPNQPQDLGIAEKRLILIAALLQGLALYALKFFAAVEHWSPVWQFLCYTLVITLPPLIIVTVAPRLARGYWWIVAAYAALLALLASYRGYQCTPADMIDCNWPFAFCVAVVVATFIVAFLLRAGATDTAQLRWPDYSAQFHYSWDIALTVGLTLIFTGIFWLILFLWQSLFKLVGVGFFKELFEEDWFFYPVTWLVAGCGAILFRSQQSFVLTLKRLLRTMLVALLPLLAVLTVVFLATLPFTGLQPIWDTGHGSALLLWLLALLLFFTNGVIQDEFPFARYPKWINRLLLLALVLAPIYAAFALYGLFLRVHQYGWTPERLWGFVVALTLALLAVSYSIAILRRGGHWADWLPRLNSGLALWVLAVCLITQSPLANFWRISADSQAARLQDGRVALADFDFFFLRQKLGRPGLEALQSLQTLPIVQQDNDIAAHLQQLLAPKIDGKLRENPLQIHARAQRVREIPVLPEGAPPPPQHADLGAAGRACEQEGRACLWLVQDLDGDGAPEYLLFEHRDSSTDQRHWLRITAHTAGDGGWAVFADSSRTTTESFDQLQERLARGNFALRASRWQSLYLDDELLFDPTQ
ncbi:DUF4153 domain-containing protein [Microbulbifer salipaludis]|uniref:DUF4153 domain-containing protein n=1 Tax=Microbulbifer salipaludis TaxID=187980 RepID=A0ABS3E2T0_9GAMM|nr:DUF4153 domain-containing protein [Microbulbifer salipaludis]MBN8429609.1 DUF4153 domain-containing protein [Microbulbifer salipaludis]